MTNSLASRRNKPQTQRVALVWGTKFRNTGLPIGKTVHFTSTKKRHPTTTETAKATATNPSRCKSPLPFSVAIVTFVSMATLLALPDSLYYSL